MGPDEKQGNPNFIDSKSGDFRQAITSPYQDRGALTLTLDPGAPAGVTLDAGTGRLAWTPSETQAPSTNTLTLRVTDNGTPPLSDTKSFTVIVAAQPSVPARLSAALLQNGNVRLAWTTASGRAYTLQRSTDLADWQDVITINASSESSEYVDTEVSAAQSRFFRVVQQSSPCLR